MTGAVAISLVTRHQGVRVPVRDHRGELIGINTGEVSLSLLPPCSHFTEQALDFLNELDENSLAEQDVDPGVKDRVKRGKTYCP